MRCDVGCHKEGGDSCYKSVSRLVEGLVAWWLLWFSEVAESVVVSLHAEVSWVESDGSSAFASGCSVSKVVEGGKDEDDDDYDGNKEGDPRESFS